MMPFAPIPELLEEIRAGRMVVIVDDEDRENEGDLIMAAELVRPADINFMVTHARGLVCLSLTRERCAQLGPGADGAGQYRAVPHQFHRQHRGGRRRHHRHLRLRPRAHHPHRGAAGCEAERPVSQPGHIFPLTAQPGGVLTRAGHTEAASDLPMLAGLEPAGVLVEVLNADGSMARGRNWKCSRASTA
jgi:3,4-dihydroxy 2-butanone 4-phosphate synthase/GTP cyclohydrolase II